MGTFGKIENRGGLANEEPNYSKEYDKYVKCMLAEMSFHDLKMNGVNRDGTQRYRRLIDLKGGHTHNHIGNYELRRIHTANERKWLRKNMGNR